MIERRAAFTGGPLFFCYGPMHERRAVRRGSAPEYRAMNTR
jgi:hypothetical protein